LLDVGDGEALLIESLTGRFVLVQGGGARLEALAAGLCSGRTETAGLSCLRMASSCGWKWQETKTTIHDCSLKLNSEWFRGMLAQSIFWVN
jgi:hypothetical protein